VTLTGKLDQPRAVTSAVTEYRSSWPAWLAACAAFVQVGLTVLLLLQAAEEGKLRAGIAGVNIYSLLDVVILSAFAIATLKRHLWAAYGLVGYGLFEYVVNVVQRGEPWAAYFVIYLIAAWFLRKKPHVAPETVRTLQWRSIIKYAVVWWVGFEIVDFIFGLLGLTQGGVHRSTEAGIAHMLLLVVWGNALFGFQAWRARAWPFETVLATSIAAFPLNVFDALVVQLTPASLLLRLLGTVAIAMLGVACASMLPRNTALEAET
jgi:hypothetical protein